MSKTPAEILAERRALAARIEECKVRAEETLLNTTSTLKRSQIVMSRANEIIRQNDKALRRLLPDHPVSKPVKPKR